MTARFMSGTPYAASEREMQRIPGFQPRRSGFMVSRLAEGSWEGREDGCRQKKEGGRCFCEDFRRRFMEGGTEEIFREHFQELVFRPQPFLTENGHRSSFRKCFERRELNADRNAWCAALYLLTADRELWKGAAAAVMPGYIDFSAISVRGVDMDGYVLYHTAKDLYQGSGHISLAELTDGELVSERAFRLMVNAFLICRYGPCLLAEETEGRNV